MVAALSPHRSHRFACSDACRVGAIAAGPSPVLLPPDGPSDLPGQLVLDAALLRRYRWERPDDPEVPATADQRDWLGTPIGSVAGAAGAIAQQLAPIRSRQTLLSSYRREAHHTPALRLAYAVRWLALAQGMPFGLIAHRRGRRTAGTRTR